MENNDVFNEANYAQRLIDGGIDPAQARALAARTAEERRPKTVIDKTSTRSAVKPPAEQSLQAVGKLLQKALPSASAEASQTDLFAGTETQPTNPPPTAPAKRGRGRPRKTDQPETRSNSYIAELVEASLDVEARAAREAKEIGFMSTIWACATLPHSELLDSMILQSITDKAMAGGMSLAEARALAAGKARVTQFQRSNGLTTLKVIGDPEFGLPYGKVPRVLMAWICTEAKRTGSPHLLLGKSQGEFMRKLRMTPTGGKNGSITALKDQSRKLFSSMISVQQTYRNEYRFKNVLIADDGMLLWNPERPDEPQLWESTLTLSQRFFQQVAESSFPIDMRVVNALRSPLAIDIYLWLTWRLREVKGGKTVVPWEALRLQFGVDYEDSANGLHGFKVNFMKRLKDVLKFYPAAKVRPLKQGLLLQESPPHVPGLLLPDGA